MTRHPKHRAPDSRPTLNALVPPAPAWPADGVARLLAAVAAANPDDPDDVTDLTLVTTEGAC